MKNELWIVLNEDYEPLMDEILVQKFEVKGKAPTITQIKILPSEKFEFLADFEISFSGNVSFTIETNLFLNLVVVNLIFLFFIGF